MDFLVANWHLFLLATISGIALFMPSLKNTADGINPSQAVEFINQERAVVIDVREVDEFSTGFITNSKNLPLSQVQELLTKTVKKKNLPIIWVCAAGVRSAKALKIAKDLGYERNFNLIGGVKSWISAGFPLVKK